MCGLPIKKLSWITFKLDWVLYIFFVHLGIFPYTAYWEEEG